VGAVDARVFGNLAEIVPVEGDVQRATSTSARSASEV
jgi:hypothetical protein